MSIGPLILRWVLALLALVISVVVLVAIVLAILIATGGPSASGECGDRPVLNESALAGNWQSGWDGFNSTLDAGQNSSVTFDESETTSRANRFLEEENVPVVSDVTICFHDGSADAYGKAEVPGLAGIPVLGGLFDANAKVTGSIDLSGTEPRIQIDDLDVGNVPGPVADRVQDRIEDAVNDALADFEINHHYSVAFTEGQVTVDGSP